MIRQLLFKNILGFALLTFSCSFIYLSDFKDREIAENQVSCGNNTFSLHFGGLEEIGVGNWLNIPNVEHFKTNIYLSDVDLNDATFNTNQNIILELSTFTAARDFKSGTYEVRGNNYEISKSSESLIKAKLLNLNGSEKTPEITSGQIKFSGTYPEIKIDLLLSMANGEKIQGSFYRDLADFKYHF
ncbi:hypothetical protein SAMN06298216_3840 [Spirosomataceae bacterium TFI 002]|nr:hypothetical protein SAMN06298216_3840 [Spirosomataceae bacterium TFI 002]